MGPSIAQSLRRLLLDLEAALTSAIASALDGSTVAGLGELAAGVASIDAAAAPGESSRVPGSLPVCRFWDDALGAAARGVARPLADALGTLAPALSWTQNPNYRRQPPDATFLDSYGYAVIAGPADGPPALVLAEHLALGVLLLGPRTHYRLHAHPAIEVYYTLTADGEWWRDAGPWRTEPAGTAIYHAPRVRHATRAGATPLLALYVWSGDLATHARLA